MIADTTITHWHEDEIESIKYLGTADTIDINVSDNRLFYANDILTHNSAVEEIEFDHSHISGGLSKIMTADNVIGIFTSRAMKERGRYQIQFMKTRSSSGVGQKVDLEFNVETLRITDLDEEDSDSFNSSTSGGKSNVFQGLKRTSVITSTGGTVDSDGVITPDPTQGNAVGKSGRLAPGSGAPMMRNMLNRINPERD